MTPVHLDKQDGWTACGKRTAEGNHRTTPKPAGVTCKGCQRTLYFQQREKAAQP